MAMIKCPECGKDISDAATVCPSCGRSMSMKRTETALVMIKCPECGRDISDEAASCPFCGKPIRAVVNTRPASKKGSEAITIELTSKRWKLITLASWLIIACGVLYIGTGTGIGLQNSHGPPGLNIIVIGILGLFVAKVGAWWNHK